MEAEKKQFKRPGEAAKVEASHSLRVSSDHIIYLASLVDSKFQGNVIVSYVNFLQEGRTT